MAEAFRRCIQQLSKKQSGRQAEQRLLKAASLNRDCCQRGMVTQTWLQVSVWCLSLEGCRLMHQPASVCRDLRDRISSMHCQCSLVLRSLLPCPSPIPHCRGRRGAGQGVTSVHCGVRTVVLVLCKSVGHGFRTHRQYTTASAAWLHWQTCICCLMPAHGGGDVRCATIAVVRTICCCFSY